MFDIDSVDTQNQSATATVCEQAALYGATPERGEFYPRGQRQLFFPSATIGIAGFSGPESRVEDREFSCCC